MDGNDELFQKQIECPQLKAVKNIFLNYELQMKFIF